MPAIPEQLLQGGIGLNESHTPDGTSLLDLLNGIVYDASQLKGSAPATITSPLGTAVPAHGIGSALGAYATPAAPTDVEFAADRTRMNELRTAVISLNDYMTAVRTEIVALRATQTTRAGLTLHWSAQSSYTP
jgi:hypothetical protein